ncbi:PEP-CTERM sorting domain-containing protein [Neorhodopirellula lusitana]|uniref:PEP-CTERM sorting domain-containing protein n=1 Tax=Neorhodopirellula lusitana TaxID=445327 RepID=UPI00384FAAAD
MKITTLVAFLTAAIGVGANAPAEVVYQDNFNAADGIGINAGIGGGLTSSTNIGAADPFDDLTGNAVAQTDFGNRVAWAYTNNQFDLSGGFKLDVTFTTAALDDSFPSFVSSFGIVDEVTATVTNETDSLGDRGNLNSFMFADQDDLNAVGFAVAARPATDNAPGLYSDFGTLTEVSSALDSAILLGTTQTFSMTVLTDGSAEFSLDGASGSLAAGTLSSLFTDSTDGEYYFVAYSQGNPGFSLSDVTITAVPEPTSLAFLGVGGLLVARRRRKKSS